MFFNKSSTNQYGSLDLDAYEGDDGHSPDLENNPRARLQTSVFSSCPPFSDTNPADVPPLITHRSTARDDELVSRLASMRSETVLEALESHSVERLGEIIATDAEVSAAFGKNQILTCDSDRPDDPNWEQTWKSIISKVAKTRRKGSTGTKLTAFCVTIKDAAAPMENGILRPLMQKEHEGFADDDIWNSPAVRAVINYKWHHWAKRLLIIEFALYMGWLLSFLLYLIIYIQKDLKESFDHMNTEDRTLRAIAQMCTVSAFIFMCPFLVIEFKSIQYYKWQWFELWNMLDICAYTLQLLITIFFYTHTIFRDKYYSTLLALQCSILFIKVQYFSRLVGVGAAYIDSFSALIYRVRYFLLFIVTTMISAALSFAVLYKEDISHLGDEGSNSDAINDSLHAFQTVPRAIVTTYAILLGSFESSFFEDTENKPVKGIFFIVFQLFMSITVLNLLIAVMTEAYQTINAKKKALYNKSRAMLIDELEITIPARFLPKPKAYIHFIVVQKKRLKPSYHRDLLSDELSQNDEIGETKETLERLEKMIEKLQNDVSMLRNERT